MYEPKVCEVTKFILVQARIFNMDKLVDESAHKPRMIILIN